MQEWYYMYLHQHFLINVSCLFWEVNCEVVLSHYVVYAPYTIDNSKFHDFQPFIFNQYNGKGIIIN
jgi:hypothetical protein